MESLILNWSFSAEQIISYFSVQFEASAWHCYWQVRCAQDWRFITENQNSKLFLPELEILWAGFYWWYFPHLANFSITTEQPRAGWLELLAKHKQQTVIGVRRGDCVLVSSYGPELMLFALWLRTSVHHGPVALFPLLTMDELFCSLCCLSSYSIDQFDANFGKDETNLPGSVRSTPRIKSNPHTSRKLRLDLVKNFLLNIFWRPKMFLVRKYFVIGVVHYSHDHISDKGCWSIILMFPSQSAKFWAKQIIHQ